MLRLDAVLVAVAVLIALIVAAAIALSHGIARSWHAWWPAYAVFGGIACAVLAVLTYHRA